jgi:hypothetical protein
VKFAQRIYERTDHPITLTDQQHRMIEDSLSPADWPMPEASRHRVAGMSIPGKGHADCPWWKRGIALNGIEASLETP